MRKKSIPVENKPEIDPEMGIELLTEQLKKGEEFISNRPIKDDDYYNWHEETKTYLDKAFGKGIKHLGSGGGMVMPDMSEAEAQRYWENEHFETITSDLTKVKNYIGQLETEIKIKKRSNTPASKTVEKNNKDVFIVFGHGIAIFEEVRQFIGNCDLNPIVLKDIAGQGRTIIEKFIDHSNVGYAIALFTADDVGKAKDEPELNKRARQNVIFELGYFIGLLNRKNVCVLYEDEVEILSDYEGVEYIALDSESQWKKKLIRELKAADMAINFEKVIDLL